MRLPTIKGLASVLKGVKPYIEDQFIDPDDDSGLPGVDVTVGWNPKNGGWNYQTGDNSFTGAAYHYPVWASTRLYRRSNCKELARDIRRELDDQVEDEE